jgi:hypothetical protein
MKFNKFRAIKISKAEIKKIINKYKEFNKKNHIWETYINQRRGNKFNNLTLLKWITNMIKFY